MPVPLWRGVYRQLLPVLDNTIVRRQRALLLLFLQNRTATARVGIYTILFHSSRLPVLVSLKTQDAELRYVTLKGTSYLVGDCEIYNETETTRDGSQRLPADYFVIYNLFYFFRT